MLQPQQTEQQVNQRSRNNNYCAWGGGGGGGNLPPPPPPPPEAALEALVLISARLDIDFHLQYEGMGITVDTMSLIAKGISTILWPKV